MSPTRIYLPLNAVRLRELAENRVVGPSPLSAPGVTDGVRAADPTGDDEEWEYAALGEAARAVGGRAAAGERRRVVAAADVDGLGVEPLPTAAAMASAVTVSEPVPLQRIASFHVDETDVGRRRRPAVVRRHRADGPARPLLIRLRHSVFAVGASTGVRGQPRVDARVEGLRPVAAHAVAGAVDDGDLEVVVAQGLDRPAHLRAQDHVTRAGDDEGGHADRCGDRGPRRVQEGQAGREEAEVAVRLRAAPRAELCLRPAGVLGLAEGHGRLDVVPELLAGRHAFHRALVPVRPRHLVEPGRVLQHRRRTSSGWRAATAAAMPPPIECPISTTGSAPPPEISETRSTVSRYISLDRVGGQLVSGVAR